MPLSLYLPFPTKSLSHGLPCGEAMTKNDSMTNQHYNLHLLVKALSLVLSKIHYKKILVAESQLEWVKTKLPAA